MLTTTRDRRISQPFPPGSEQVNPRRTSDLAPIRELSTVEDQPLRKSTTNDQRRQKKKKDEKQTKQISAGYIRGNTIGKKKKKFVDPAEADTNWW